MTASVIIGIVAGRCGRGAQPGGAGKVVIAFHAVPFQCKIMLLSGVPVV